MRFYSDHELQQHYQDEHYKCRICERMGRGDIWFQGVGELLNHIRLDHISCVRCGGLVGFASSEELEQHMQSFHDDELAARGQGEVVVGVDPLRNELRIQLSIPQRAAEQGNSTRMRESIAQNRDRLRTNLVQLLSYFREILGNSEAAVYTIEEIIRHFDSRMDMLTTSNEAQSSSNEDESDQPILTEDNTQGQQESDTEELRILLQNSTEDEVSNTVLNGSYQRDFEENYNINSIPNDGNVEEIGTQRQSMELDSMTGDDEEEGNSTETSETRIETNDISQGMLEFDLGTQMQVLGEEAQDAEETEANVQLQHQERYQINLFRHNNLEQLMPTSQKCG
eukprot:TRINITY_DN39234_c0_g1_i3.p1 TRINITY_DN39234_c0_g1~~TRINITY_DN39234_c0_g1_i3.p1  ORF type:complete len:361 (+),score=37.11 TRINITY_DN39234_c0_g1_i3:69-1085(+)